MSIILMLYLADTVQNLIQISHIIGVILTFLTVGFFIVSTVENHAVGKRYAFNFAKATFILGLIVVLAPTKTVFYSAAALQLGQEIAKEPKVQELSAKAFQVIELELDKVLDQKQPTKEK